MRTIVLSSLFIFSCTVLFAQQPTRARKEKKGTFYLALGSHRIFYTPSTIHLKSGAHPSSEFTLERVRARDEGGLRFKTAPEFSYTVGYYFNRKKFGIEYQYNHIKYFIRERQVVRLRGTIDGRQYDTDTLINPDLIMLEHSDGGNYAMVNLVKWVPLVKGKSGQPFIDLLLKAGAGVVNPKTNSTILGNHRDDKYHISGYVMGLESGVRVHFLRHFFATGSFKGAYAHYNSFLIAGGRGNQKWFSGQFTYMLGGQFPL